MEKKFEKYKSLLKKQLNILKPDIIVACGKIGNEGIFGKIVEEVLNETLKDKNAGEIKVNINSQPVKILFSYHPSKPQSYEEFLKQIEEKMKNLN